MSKQQAPVHDAGTVQRRSTARSTANEDTDPLLDLEKAILAGDLSTTLALLAREGESAFNYICRGQQKRSSGTLKSEKTLDPIMSRLLRDGMAGRSTTDEANLRVFFYNLHNLGKTIVLKDWLGLPMVSSTRQPIETRFGLGDEKTGYRKPLEETSEPKTRAGGLFGKDDLDGMLDGILSMPWQHVDPAADRSSYYKDFRPGPATSWTEQQITMQSSATYGKQWAKKQDPEALRAQVAEQVFDERGKNKGPEAEAAMREKAKANPEAFSRHVNRRQPGFVAAKGRELFAHGVRHEIGHAIDDSVGASTKLREELEWHEVDAEDWISRQGGLGKDTPAEGYGAAAVEVTKAWAKASAPADAKAFAKENCGNDVDDSEAFASWFASTILCTTLLASKDPLSVDKHKVGNKGYFVGGDDSLQVIGSTALAHLKSWKNGKAAWAIKEYVAELYAEYYSTETPGQSAGAKTFGPIQQRYLQAVASFDP